MTLINYTATKQPRPLAVRALEVHSLCDVCSKYRNHGNHTKCSKIRQARNAHKLTK